MINALTRIKYVPLAYNHASLHMSAILMTLMSLNMQHMLGTRLPKQIFCNVYRMCIDRTQSACKQATTCLHTSFFLQAEGQDVAGCEQQETYLLYVNNMTSITQMMITRLPVAQRVFHTRYAKTIRIPRHHRTALRATATQRTTTRFTASFTTICRNIQGLNPKIDNQSRENTNCLRQQQVSVPPVRYNVTDANNQQCTQRTAGSSTTVLFNGC